MMRESKKKNVTALAKRGTWFLWGDSTERSEGSFMTKTT